MLIKLRHNFRFVAGYLLFFLFLKKNYSFLNDWILDVVERFSSNLNFHKKVNFRKLSEKKMLSFNEKWNLISAYFALFCVENRLKTPVGKAVQTFLKFESIIYIFI